MPKIKIVTDSTADLPTELVKEYGITVVPLEVHFGEEVYLDGVDMNSSQFFKKLKASDTISSTSQPTPVEFAKVYENIVKNGDNVLSIHISSRMSGTIQSALLAKTMFPNSIIEVVDSRFVSMATGLIVLEAARLVKEGVGLEDILKHIVAVQNTMRVYFYVDTLRYMELGGRIGKATAFLGTLLNIKPLLTIEDGLVGPYEKIRGKNKAIRRVLQIVEEETKGEKVRGAIVHGDNLTEMEYLYGILSEQPSFTSLVKSELGAVVGTHAGPGMVGIIFHRRF